MPSHAAQLQHLIISPSIFLHQWHRAAGWTSQVFFHILGSFRNTTIVFYYLYSFRGPMNTESESDVATVDAILDEHLYMTSEGV
jgi:hypothetical protein